LAIRQKYQREEEGTHRYPVDLYTKVYSLQTLCLISFSTRYYQPIDSIQLEIKVSHSSGLINKFHIRDPRGVPIKLRDLSPYSQTELQDYIEPHYLEWRRAGGLERCLAGESSFYLDLWEITKQEDPSVVLEWYLPEVRVEEGVHQGTEVEALQEHPDLGPALQIQELTHLKQVEEEETAQHHHSLGSSHQGTEDQRHLKMQQLKKDSSQQVTWTWSKQKKT
jgi:hypothetical protein